MMMMIIIIIERGRFGIFVFIINFICWLDWLTYWQYPTLIS